MIIGIDASRALRAQRTGTERYSVEIIRYLLRLPAAATHQWRLYTSEPAPVSFFYPSERGVSLPNIEVRILPQSRLWTHRRLAAEVAADPPDVLFVPAHVLPVMLPPRHLPPSVITIHDVGFHYYPEAHRWGARTYLEWSTRDAVHRATRLIAVSQATAQDLAAIYGAPSSRVRVIYEAATPMPVPSPGTIKAVRERLGIRRPYALYVGTIQPRKNLVRLVQAYAKLHARGEAEFDLVIAGRTGWLGQPVFDEVNRLNLGGHVLLPGYVSDDDLPPLLHSARLFCYPSLIEGFGLPVLEAQRAGVPVLTSNNSSLPEIAGDGALLVDPLDVDALADAMLRLSSDEPLRARLIAAGQANLTRFSWAKAAAETLTVLEEAAGSTAQTG